jgi:O-antigen biosynthesis protein WbqP
MDSNVIGVEQGKPEMYRNYIKRLLDIISSTVLLILLVPLFIAVAIWIKLDSRGPVFFKQKRGGKNLVPFKVYKFRTMRTEAPRNTPTSMLRDSNLYITKSGRIMRKLSIDELPQLINVWLGEMSIVGPRPVVMGEEELFVAREKYGANTCVPGITGWAQVNGRDEVRIAEKARMDGVYAKNLSFFMDVKCVLLTVATVMSIKGHKEGHEIESMSDVIIRTDEILVSIVVPIYNVEKYLVECFNSIVRQTHKRIEIILVDDGSKDSSGEIADTLAKTDKRVTVVHKVNGGLSDARNVGIRLAKGEYITFVDSDDSIDTEFIKKLLKLAQKSNVEIAQCDNSRDVSMLGTGTGNSYTIQSQDAFVELMKFKVVSPTAWGKLYKTSLFHDNELEFPVGRLHEDTAVLYKLVYFASAIACMDSVLYYYRINNNSIMSSAYTKNHYDSVIKYHSELDEFIDANQLVIDKTTIHRHKALRLLSVLNKLALSNSKSNKSIYKELRQEYINLSIKSRSVMCLIGIAPVYLPYIFRSARQVNPVIRSLLGKT